MEIDKQLETFEKFLLKSGFSSSSVRSYRCVLRKYLFENPDAVSYSYSQVINALGSLTKSIRSSNYRISFLGSVKKYYDFLIETGIRNDHPCKAVYFKNPRRKEVITQDLFTSKELEELLNREERYSDVALKNKAIISLMIYQALTPGEIARMKLSHIDFGTGKIFVKESREIFRRHLDIQPNQFRILDRYIQESRKKLLKVKTDTLFVGIRGEPIKVSQMNYLLEQFKELYPDRNLNPLTVRQSVIANWLNEKKLPLETVQLLAGHKWISTTIKYRSSLTDEKRVLINRFHPLS